MNRMSDPAARTKAWELGRVCILVLAGAVPAFAGPVELLRPATGEGLVGGSVAVVEWAPRAGFEGLAAEEWEAFLSFDGGGYYAVRLTPHLDLALRRFYFVVPDVPTEEARILLRFGDELREIGFEMPRRFRIEAGGPPLPAHAARAVARGEAARPGEAGVLAWVEGSRGATGLRQRQARPASALSPSVRPALGARAVLLASEPRRLSPRAVERGEVRAPPAGARHAANLPQSLLRSSTILLLVSRVNE